jgi:hypothetical protein
MPKAEQIDRALAFDLERGGSVGSAHGRYINLLQRDGRKIYFLSSNVTRENEFLYSVSIIEQAGLRRLVQASNRFSRVTSKACRLEMFLLNILKLTYQDTAFGTAVRLAKGRQRCQLGDPSSWVRSIK